MPLWCGPSSCTGVLKCVQESLDHKGRYEDSLASLDVLSDIPYARPLR